MKKRKLRGFVLPTIYLLVIVLFAVVVSFLSKSILDKQIPSKDHEYATTVFNDEETNEEPQKSLETSQNQVSLPIIGDNVKVEKDFYQEEDTPENQEKSLIYYENTYMQNTGILYSSDEVFDIIATIDGTIKEIKQDEILGTVLTLEGENKVVCEYYTLGDVLVKQGDKVKQNDIIAKSGQGKIETTKQTLLFEVYIDGTLTNPNTFYGKKITELN